MMRKKLTGLFAILACLLVLTACSGAASDDTEPIEEQTITSLYSLTESTVQSMDEVVSAGLIEDQKSNKVVYKGLQDWEKAKEEIGTIDFTADADGNGLADCFTEKGVTADEDGNYIVTVEVTGDKKSADLVATYNKDLTDYVSLVTNINYSSGELIQQAAMNTLLGMGTTFGVLILLSLIIALFGKIFTERARKKAEEEAAKDQGTAQKSGAGTASGGSSDSLPADGALIAVITAAVAAYREQAEPDAEPGAFVVRKIRRLHKNH